VQGAEAEAILACTLLLGIPARRRNWGGWSTCWFFSLPWPAAYSRAVMAVAVAAVGGGEGAIPGTTAGTHAVTITCTSGSTMGTGKVTLTVQ
jgi:hypothetical protein